MRFKNNYKLLLEVRKDGKPVHYISAKETFLVNVMKKLKFELKDNDGVGYVVVQNPTVHHESSYSTKTQLFIDLHYKLDRMLLIDLEYTEEKVIKGIEMKLLDKSDCEVVNLVIDF